jgi:hypothetical protein
VATSANCRFEAVTDQRRFVADAHYVLKTVDDNRASGVTTSFTKTPTANNHDDAMPLKWRNLLPHGMILASA